jgi:hypothetical protein
MAGLVPYWITGGWDGPRAPLALQVTGAVLLAAPPIYVAEDQLIAPAGWREPSVTSPL